MNSVMNPVGTYGFSGPQTSLGSGARGYCPPGPSSMGPRPSFAIQELLGLGMPQVGTGPQTQGFSPQFFNNDPVCSMASTPSAAMPGYTYQNLSAAPPAMQPCPMTGEDLGPMSPVYGSSWRSGFFPTAYQRDDMSSHGRQLTMETTSPPHDKHMGAALHNPGKN